jgi:hypothetical protein
MAFWRVSVGAFCGLGVCERAMKLNTYARDEASQMRAIWRYCPGRCKAAADQAVGLGLSLKEAVNSCGRTTCPLWAWRHGTYPTGIPGVRKGTAAGVCKNDTPSEKKNGAE